MVASFKLLFLSIITSLSVAASLPPHNKTCLVNKLAKGKVPVVLPGEGTYEQFARPFNLRAVYEPAAIALPTSYEHVVQAVNAAAHCNVKVQAKSGGHSYASYSSGGEDGALVIDLQNFNSVTVAEDGIAAVGGGVRLGNLDEGLWEQGQRAVSHGTCLGVGIGGHYLHGGYGYDSRLWGLAIDSIHGIEAVIPNKGDAKVVRYNVTQDDDSIMWAFRGAGDSFGVVTKFFLNTNEAPKSVFTFTFSFSDMYSSAQKLTDAFLHIQSFALNATLIDRKLTFGMFLDGSAFLVRGKYFGDKASWDKIETELLRDLPQPNNDSTVVDSGWVESQIYFSGENDLEQPLTNYSAHDFFFAKSVTTPEAHPLTEEAFFSYFTYILEKGIPGPSPWFSIVNLYGGPDSQISSNPNAGFSSYPDRETLWVLQHYTNVPYTIENYTQVVLPPGAFDFLDGLNHALTDAMPDVKFGGYVNYIDPTLSRREAVDQYYNAFTNGSAIFEELVKIKSSIDPLDVFWNPQSIPTLAEWKEDE